MEKLLIFIESNTTGTGLLFLKKAKQLGFAVKLFAGSKEFYHFPKYIEVVEIDTTSIETICASINALSKQYQVVGVTSTSEYFLETVAQVAKIMGLPGAEPRIVALCRNKFFLREKLLETRFLTPKFLKVNSLKNLALERNTPQFPVVAKPVAGSGSVGVKYCSDKAELDEHIRNLLAEPMNERRLESSKDVLIEEYIEGREFSAEIFNGEIIGITKKHLSLLPYFIETGHDFPAKLNHYELCTIKRDLSILINILNLTWGPLHIEFRLNEGGLYIIEINHRLAGGYIPRLIHYAYNLDLIEKVINNVTGLQVETPVNHTVNSSIRFIVAHSGGILQNPYTSEEMANLLNVEEVVFYKEKGEHIEVHGDFRDRIGILL